MLFIIAVLVLMVLSVFAIFWLLDKDDSDPHNTDPRNIYPWWDDAD